MSNLDKTTWKTKLHEIIYEADTPAGKLFDVVLLITITFQNGLSQSCLVWSILLELLP